VLKVERRHLTTSQTRAAGSERGKHSPMQAQGRPCQAEASRGGDERTSWVDLRPGEENPHRLKAPDANLPCVLGPAHLHEGFWG